MDSKFIFILYRVKKKRKIRKNTSININTNMNISINRIKWKKKAKKITQFLKWKKKPWHLEVLAVMIPQETWVFLFDLVVLSNHIILKYLWIDKNKKNFVKKPPSSICTNGLKFCLNSYIYTIICITLKE